MLGQHPTQKMRTFFPEKIKIKKKNKKMGESFYYFKLGFDCTTSLQFLLLKQSAERTYLSPIINTLTLKNHFPFLN